MSKSNARPFSKMAKYPSYLRPSNLEETANFQHSKRSRDLNPMNGCYFSIVNLRRCNKRGNNSGLHGWCCVGMADCGDLSLSWSTYVSSLEVCDLIDRGVWPSHWGVPLFFGLRYIKKILIL
jgi:hypothetical protein